MTEVRESLSRHAARGVAWSALESLGSSGISFIVSIVLARFLSPGDFGLVAMLQVFVAIACLCVDSGMTQALIRRPERRPAEESTALLLNLLIGVAAYLSLYLLAPVVADFYREPRLVPLMRLICFSVPLNSMCVVQTARLTSAMRFDVLCRATGVSVIASGILGIRLAWSGAGVWALAWQQVSLWGIRSLLLWITVPWQSGWRFCSAEARSLFSFSWKLLGASLLDTLWTNIYTVVIGKFHTSGAAGLFWRANTFAMLPASTATSVVHRVAYPLLSRAGCLPSRLNVLFLRVLGMSMWLIFPVMALSAALATPLFGLLFNAEWQGAVPMFRVICMAAMFYPVHALNLMLLNVAGRSDLFLRLEIIKKLLTAIMLCVTMPFGVEAICIGILVNSIVSLPLNMWYSGRLACVACGRQLRMMLPLLLLTALSAVSAFAVSALFGNQWISIGAGLIAGIIIYIAGTLSAGMPWLSRLLSKKI